jgi:hypothetical protein
VVDSPGSSDRPPPDPLFPGLSPSFGAPTPPVAPQPPPPAPAGQAREYPVPDVVPLAFDIRSASEWMPSQMRRHAPAATVDGQRVPVYWGRCAVPVFNGEHEVRIWVGLSGSPATVHVDTRPGPQTVYYAQSVVPGRPGNIGLSPVQNPDRARRRRTFTIMLIVMGAILLINMIFFCGVPFYTFR